MEMNPFPNPNFWPESFGTASELRKSAGSKPDIVLEKIAPADFDLPLMLANANLKDAESSQIPEIRQPQPDSMTKTLEDFALKSALGASDGNSDNSPLGQLLEKMDVRQGGEVLEIRKSGLDDGRRLGARGEVIETNLEKRFDGSAVDRFLDTVAKIIKNAPDPSNAIDLGVVKLATVMAGGE